MSRVRVRYRVTGVVQGVGFRPFVYVQASGLGLSGSVANDAAGVVAEVEGEAGAVAELGRRLTAQPPPLAAVESVTATQLDPVGGTGFRIAGSERGGAGARTFAGPDVATCADCLRELADPADRRYRHPFISCTNCGPRFTIIRELPYDRPTTTMAPFDMCRSCAGEYADPADRRFHAQPIACHDCGPALRLHRPSAAGCDGEDALRATRRLLADGAIVAVKGLGGYHLACDASNQAAVAELRRRKRRGDKPFAVMVRDLAAARALATVDEPDGGAAGRPPPPDRTAGPTPGRTPLAAAVAPGDPDLGLMLPYTPVHTLLLGRPGIRTGLPGDDVRKPRRGADRLPATTTPPSGWPRWWTPGCGTTGRSRCRCDDSVTRVVDGAEATGPPLPRVRPAAGGAAGRPSPRRSPSAAT